MGVGVWNVLTILSTSLHISRLVANGISIMSSVKLSVPSHLPDPSMPCPYKIARHSFFFMVAVGTVVSISAIAYSGNTTILVSVSTVAPVSASACRKLLCVLLSLSCKRVSLSKYSINALTLIVCLSLFSTE